MQTENSQKKTRGRPSIKIEWPNSPFTVEDVKAIVGEKLTKVAIQLKIKKAIEGNVLIKVGTQKTTRRPRITYQKSITVS